MSVIIQNVTERDGHGEYGKGLQHYELRINAKIIAQFTHTYENGLARCLELAARAAKNPNRFEVQADNELIKALVEASSK